MNLLIFGTPVKKTTSIWSTNGYCHILLTFLAMWRQKFENFILGHTVWNLEDYVSQNLIPRLRPNNKDRPRLAPLYTDIDSKVAFYKLRQRNAEGDILCPRITDGNNKSAGQKLPHTAIYHSHAEIRGVGRDIWRACFQNVIHPLLYMLLICSSGHSKVANFQHKIHCKWNM